MEPKNRINQDIKIIVNVFLESELSVSLPLLPVSEGPPMLNLAVAALTLICSCTHVLASNVHSCQRYSYFFLWEQSLSLYRFHRHRVLQLIV